MRKNKIIKKYELAYSASTLEGSSESPIFLKYSPQVIGIHKQGGKTENYGDFIGHIFKYFKNYYKTDDNSDDSQTYETTSITNHDINDSDQIKFIEKTRKKNSSFTTRNGITHYVFMNSNKKIKDLIKLFFKKIKQPELFKDKDIVFLCSGTQINNSNYNKLISEKRKKNGPFDGSLTFLVIDHYFKIKDI